MQFVPHTQGNQQIATFATVKEAIIQHIQKTDKTTQDVVDSLKKGVLTNLSTQKPI